MDKKKSEEECESSSESVILRFIHMEADVKEVHMKMKRDTRFGKAMAAYSDIIGIKLEEVRFIGGGRRITEKDTLNDIGLQDGDDVINVVNPLKGCVCGCGLEPGHLLLSS